MLRKVRNEWVDALRSGDYLQTRGVFKDDTGCYCCLGVLAEIEGFLSGDLDADSFTAIGLTFDHYAELAELNDLVKLDFPSIANWIEVKVPVDD